MTAGIHDLPEPFDQIASILVGDETIDAILDRLVNLAKESNPRAAGIGITLSRDGKPTTAAYSDNLVKEIDRMQYSLDEGPCLQAMRTCMVINSFPLDEDDRWPRFGQQATKNGVVGTHSLPLVVRDDPIGAMNVYSTTDDPEVLIDEDLLKSFAKHAAVVVANSRAYTDAITLGEQLQEALKTRGVIGEAKGILMEREGVTADEAFAMLRNLSQNSNVKLREVAQRIVDSIEERRDQDG